jgi:hypothetical protein
MQRTLLDVALRFAISLVLVLLPTSAALAADEPAAVSVPNQSDDGSLEVGVWYVVNYENCGGWGLGNLPATAPDALGLRDRLTDQYYFFIFPYPTPRWSAPIVWGNANAWEKDWKRSGAGGWEDSQIDQVDFAYFAGHGASSGIFFGVGGNNKDDCQTSASDAQYAWGTIDNDWIGLAACNVLDNPYDSYRLWARAMNGTRLLMGFQTVMSDVDFGNGVGWYLRWGNSFTYSWFRTVNDKLPTSQVARILAEHNSYFNDTYANHNSNTVVDNTFHIWTHRSGTPIVQAANSAASQRIDIASLNGEMPVYEVVPLSLAEADERWLTVATTFGLTDTQYISNVVSASQVTSYLATNNLFVSSDGTLLMDASGGNFGYADPKRLWNEQSLVQAADASEMLTISQDDAKRYADQFLQQTGLMTPETSFAATTQDILETLEDTDRHTGVAVAASAPLRVLESRATNFNVEYRRTISYTRTISPTIFNVVGPGSSQVVYVATEVPLKASGAYQLSDFVLGADGGNRQVRPATVVNAAGVTEQLTVPMLPTSTVALLYEKLGSHVALDFVDLPAVKQEIIDYQPGYYEGEIGLNQDQLYPVYILTVRATLEDDTVQEFTTNVPVNGAYMKPYAKIVAPSGPDALAPGEQITLTAADASKTLAELGVDPALTFALGTGDPDSYLYDWYVDEISEANLIGKGRTIQYTTPSTFDAGAKPHSVRLILVVTDNLSPRDPKIAIDQLVLNFSSVFLPNVQR